MPGIDPTRPTGREEIDAQIHRALESLRYGSIEIVVHDGRVIQIERRERVRFEGEREAANSNPNRIPPAKP